VLLDQLKSDLVIAMKEKNELRLLVLRSLLSSLNYFKIEAQHELTDEDVQNVLAKEAKKHRESIEMYKKGGRNELVDSEQKELEILMLYMPKQMSEEEAENIIKVEVDRLKIKGGEINQGIVMKAVMPVLKGKADGRMVGEIVDKILNHKS
jgi:uncharacterized protein